MCQFINNKKVNADIISQSLNIDLKSFELLKETWKDEFQRLNEQVHLLLQKQAKLEIQIQHLEIENNQLREQLRDLRSLHPEMPVPMWLKDHTGKMLSLNQAYEDAFLQPLGKVRNDYIGKYDNDIWGDDIAEIFRTYDLIATSKKEFVEVEKEKFAHPLFKAWKFYKYPVYSQGTFVGIAGFALPDKKINI